MGRSLGLEIFPKVDAGRFQLRMRAPDGTRIEETEQLAIAALDTIGREVGRDRVAISVGYVGLIPSSYPINAIYQWTGGPEEAILRVAMKEGAKVDIERLKERLRTELVGAIARRAVLVRAGRHRQRGDELRLADARSTSRSPGRTSPTTAPSPRNSAPSWAGSRRCATSSTASRSTTPRSASTWTASRPGSSGVTAADIARSVVAATSSSRFVVPNYWPDPKTGIGYQVQVEIPYQIMDSLESIETVPIQRPGLDRQLLLRDVATVRPGTMPGEFDRYNMKRVGEPDRQHRRRGPGPGRRPSRAGDRAGRVPRPRERPSTCADRSGPMQEILRGLGIGLVMSIVVILLLLTANFQSVRLALVVVSTTPAVVAGVVLMLWLTGTTINLQSFMGSIMAIGVAVANAILLVTFAEQHRRDGGVPSGAWPQSKARRAGSGRS